MRKSRKSQGFRTKNNPAQSNKLQWNLSALDRVISYYLVGGPSCRRHFFMCSAKALGPFRSALPFFDKTHTVP